MGTNFKYPARIKSNGEGGYIATFRDIPEAITEADSLLSLADMAKDALITALDFYFEDSRAVPQPSSAEEGEIYVDLPLSVVAKVLVLNTMIETRTRPSELAKKMKVPRQEVSRITNLNHSTKIDTLERAMEAMGKSFSLSIA